MFHWRGATLEANAGVALIVDHGAPGANPFDMLGTSALAGLAGADRLHGLQIEVLEVRRLSLIHI